MKTRSAPAGWLHAHRAPGRHRDHRSPDLPAAPRRAVGPRGGPPNPVHQQPEADRPGVHELRERQQLLLADDDPGSLAHRRARRPGTFESSWSAFARSAPFLEQGSFYNSINFNLTYSDPPNTTVANTPLPFLYCPSDPGSPHRRRLAGRHGLRHDELRHLRRRLVRLVGQLGSDQLGRPDEPLAVRPQLLAQDRRRSPTA